MKEVSKGEKLMNKIKLESGFSFDYTNLIGEEAVKSADLKELSPKIQEALIAAEKMRKTGVIEGHLSKDGEPELVLFP